jgi:hypothetical protein
MSGFSTSSGKTVISFNSSSSGWRSRSVESTRKAVVSYDHGRDRGGQPQFRLGDPAMAVDNSSRCRIA